MEPMTCNANRTLWSSICLAQYDGKIIELRLDLDLCRRKSRSWQRGGMKNSGRNYSLYLSITSNV